MSAESTDVTLEKGDAILRAAKAERDHDSELRRRMFAPLLPSWIWWTGVVILGVMAVRSASPINGGIAAFVWVAVFQCLERRHESRIKALMEWIEHQQSQPR